MKIKFKLMTTAGIFSSATAEVLAPIDHCVLRRAIAVLRYYDYKNVDNQEAEYLTSENPDYAEACGVSLSVGGICLRNIKLHCHENDCSDFYPLLHAEPCSLGIKLLSHKLINNRSYMRAIIANVVDTAGRHFKVISDTIELVADNYIKYRPKGWARLTTVTYKLT